MRRLLGLELELFMTRDGIPLKPNQWKNIVEKAVTRGYSRIEEPYTFFPLGALGEKGQFVLDNNCAVIEMVVLPHPTMDETIENLIELIDFFQEIAPEVDLHWTSQFSKPKEDEYWERTISSGFYSIIREKKWKHWTMMNSMSFQPAIDVYPEEIPHVLRVLFLTAPVLICAFEGNKYWGKNYSPRLEFWREMYYGAEDRTGIPKREITSLADYVENLLQLPALILSGGYKKEKLIYFGIPPEAPSVGEVMFGEVAGRYLLGLQDFSDPRKVKMVVEEVRVRGSLLNFYAISLPFWHARLVFEMTEKDSVGRVEDIVRAIEKSTKLYVEIRHIGTPHNMKALKRIYESCLKLIENAKMLDEKISTVIRWHEAEKENLMAIRGSNLKRDKSSSV
jgi:hypothetical protein